MKAVDFQIGFTLNNISIEVTASKTDSIGNSKLLSFGFANQILKITKHRQELNLNMFGVTLGAYNSFEQIYMFLMRTKNTALKVVENVKSTLQQEEYVQNMKQVVEDLKGLQQVSSQRKNGRDLDDDFG